MLAYWHFGMDIKKVPGGVLQCSIIHLPWDHCMTCLAFQISPRLVKVLSHPEHHHMPHEERKKRALSGLRHARQSRWSSLKMWKQSRGRSRPDRPTRGV